MNYLLAITFPLFFVSLLKSFILFDRLLRLEYDLHHESWIVDGKPDGFFWSSNESVPSLAGYKVRYRIYIDWCFHQPKWIKPVDRRAVILMREFRIWWCIAPISGLLSLVIMFLVPILNAQR